MNKKTAKLTENAIKFHSSEEVRINAMKTVRPNWPALLVVLMSSLLAQAAPRQAATKKASDAPSFDFDALDNWKNAVLDGDKAALQRLYSINPIARSKTPDGDSIDPSEEPTFWSAFKREGLDRLDVKVLEAKSPQPDVKVLVLRIEMGLNRGGKEQTVVVGGAQVWAQRLGDWKIISTQRSNPAPKEARRLPEPAKPNTQLYPPPEEAKAEISNALAESAKDHRRVLLVFGGNWCYDCHVLDTTFRSKQFAPIVNANYRVIHINVGNYDANLDLADKYQIPLKKGVPSLAILDPDGKLVVSQKQGEFESTVRIGPEDVLEFLKKWKPEPKS